MKVVKIKPKKVIKVEHPDGRVDVTVVVPRFRTPVKTKEVK